MGPIDCRLTIYHPGGIFEELSPLPPELLLRHPNTIAYPENFFESAQAIAKHSHLRWPDLCREWIRCQQARIARVGSSKTLLDKAREMKGVQDLSALLKGKLQLLSKKTTSDVVLESTNFEEAGASKGRDSIIVDEDIGAEPSALSPKKKKKSKKAKRRVTDEAPGADVPLGEESSLGEASKGSKAKKKKEGKKSPREGTTSPADHDDMPREGREATPEDLVGADLIEARCRCQLLTEPLLLNLREERVFPETPLEKRRKVAASEGGSRRESAASERSAPDSATIRGARSEGSLTRRGEFPDRVQFSYDEKTPLIFNHPLQCTELTRQIRGGTRELPQIGDLYFKDEYVDAAFTRARVTALSFYPFLLIERVGRATSNNPYFIVLQSDVSMNFLVEKYDSTLKQTMIQLGSSEKLAQARLKAIERVRAEHKKANEKTAKEKEVLRVKFEELEGNLKSDRVAKKELSREKAHLDQAAETLEKEKAKLLEERDAAVEKLIKERQRLKDSRDLEVTREKERFQDAMTDKANRCFDAFGKAKNLYGQASGTRKCLEMIKDSGTEIPQDMIDVFAEQEKLHEAAATKLHVDPLSDSDLTLFPLVLLSRFVEDRFQAPFDPYGSNTDLIGPEMASQLITSREITEEPSAEPMVDITLAPTEHAEVPGKDTLEECPEKDNLEESPEKDNPETDGILVREEGTENAGTEDPVLVSDTSSEEREDEEEEGDRAEKTSLPKPKEEETNSEIEKKASQASLEGPIASVTEDPVNPPAPSVLNGDDQDSAASPSADVVLLKLFVFSTHFYLVGELLF
ncbi:hypothetical protein Bca52824_054271 [Brassica carinata]|uniref:Uncharacterized protein n=1 Tax=Brassica carinata TaxID=52824 RepID=A0A8X7UMJ5_BRACI|nr:hypothetical protein Bca52824_054271 [Brassica carinata]